MSTENQRLLMAKAIVEYEARRDSKGRLKVFKLDPEDGGGKYEVAGINERYHPEEARELADLIEDGKYDEAESRAKDIILSFTDGPGSWSKVASVEFYLRDTGFNRGPRGSARILQRALNVSEDGIVGSATLSALYAAEANEIDLLNRLRAARERYERKVVGRDEASKFWKGLVNRWNKSLDFALTFVVGVETRRQASLESIEEAPNTEFLKTRLLSRSNFDSAVAAIEAATMSVPSDTALEQTDFASVTAFDNDRARASEIATIRALRLGSRGALVRAWQSFLLGQGFDPGGLDGDFGDKTLAATRAFQSREMIASDGVAGRQTLLRAMQFGFELVDEPSADITGSNFPPRPSFAPLLDNAARRAVFGNFSYISKPVAGNPENIEILGTWERDNIVSVAIPQLRSAMGSSAPSSMRFHRKAANQLQGLWKAWEAAGLLDRVLTYHGAFVPRFVRGSRTTLSNHAFGSAFDINLSQNMLGTVPALVGSTGSVRELVPIANEWGFYWGGHFSSRLDGMHFEIAVLL